MARDNDLLQASLSRTDTTSSTAIYSATTGYVASFFGGPIAAAFIGLLNAWRLKRLSKDWPIAVVAIGVVAALLWWQLHMGGAAWLSEVLGERGQTALIRVSGVLFFGAIYALHYRSHRSMSVLGIEAPSGWGPGFAAVVIGTLVNVALGMMIKP